MTGDRVPASTEPSVLYRTDFPGVRFRRGKGADEISGNGAVRTTRCSNTQPVGCSGCVLQIAVVKQFGDGLDEQSGDGDGIGTMRDRIGADHARPTGCEQLFPGVLREDCVDGDENRRQSSRFSCPMVSIAVRPEDTTLSSATSSRPPLRTITRVKAENPSERQTSQSRCM